MISLHLFVALLLVAGTALLGQAHGRQLLQKKDLIRYFSASKYKAGVDVARHAPMEVEIARLCSDYFVRGWAGGDLGIGPTLYNSSINYDSVKVLDFKNLTDLEQYLECEEDYMTLPVSDNDTYTFASVIEDTGSGLKYVRNRADKALRANDFAQLGFWFMNDTTVDNVGAVMVDFTEIQEETAPYQFNFKAVYGPDIPALAQKVNMTDTAEFDTLQIFKSQKMLEMYWEDMATSEPFADLMSRIDMVMYVQFKPLNVKA